LQTKKNGGFARALKMEYKKARPPFFISKIPTLLTNIQGRGDNPIIIIYIKKYIIKKNNLHGEF